MKRAICTIDINCKEGRQVIYWDTEDKMLHSELEPEAVIGYPCETLAKAKEMAFILWGNDWHFEWIDMVMFDVYEATAKFFKSGLDLFCQIEPTYYCCGHRDLPETEEEATAALEHAWIW